MGVEDLLVRGNGLLGGANLLGRGVGGIARRRERPVTEQAGHQQEARLRRRQVAAGDRVTDGSWADDAFGIAAPDLHDRHSAVHSLPQGFVRRVRHRPIRRRTLRHESRQCGVFEVPVNAARDFRRGSRGPAIIVVESRALDDRHGRNGVSGETPASRLDSERLCTDGSR